MSLEEFKERLENGDIIRELETDIQENKIRGKKVNNQLRLLKMNQNLEL